MKTPYLYLIEPEGDRYNNVKQIEGKELIMNTTMDETDFKYTNRIGKIIGTPRRGGILEEGDRVIVHHNTFRKWFNVRGKLKDSSNYIKDGAFYAGTDQIFAYDRGDGWVTLEDYCFIEPLIDREKDLSNLYIRAGAWSTEYGKVHITNPILSEQGVEIGDTVFFDKRAAYRFDIDGKILYKMSAARNVKLVL